MLNCQLEQTTKIDTQLLDFSTIITNTSEMAKNTHTELDTLRDMVLAQAATISELQDAVINNDKKATDAIRGVLNLANGIEAHQRRWAVRIAGLDAPTTDIENSDQAKYLTLDFIKDHLKIDNVRFEDLDCAHRVGRVVAGKQTMLVRCFSRDLIQIMLKNRFHLKDTEMVLYEDSPLLNRKLLQKLKDDA
jgi:hypothetical protein